MFKLSAILLACVGEDQSFPAVIRAHLQAPLDNPAASFQRRKISVQDLGGAAAGPSDRVSGESPACAISGLYRCRFGVRFHPIRSFVMGLWFLHKTGLVFPVLRYLRLSQGA